MQNKTKLGLFLMLGLGLTDLHAQSTFTSAGSNASGTGGSASYSLGQVTYKTVNGTKASSVQGAQQPFEISVVNGQKRAFPEEVSNSSIDLSISTYPNPTSDFLNLKIEELPLENLSYQLYDIENHIVDSKKVQARESTISMTQLAASTYILRVLNNGSEVKTFKIIKY